MRWRWPRWTPSKTPRITTAAPIDGIGRGHFVRALRQNLLRLEEPVVDGSDADERSPIVEDLHRAGRLGRDRLRGAMHEAPGRLRCQRHRRKRQQDADRKDCLGEPSIGGERLELLRGDRVFRAQARGLGSRSACRWPPVPSAMPRSRAIERTYVPGPQRRSIRTSIRASALDAQQLDGLDRHAPRRQLQRVAGARRAVRGASGLLAGAEGRRPLLEFPNEGSIATLTAASSEAAHRPG